MKMDRDKKIKKEISDLNKLISNLSAEEKIFPKRLIEEAAFMKITLLELRDNINSEGVVTEMSQGEYTINVTNPSLKTYNVTIQRYNATIKQLASIVQAVAPEEDKSRGILSFVMEK